MATAPKNVKPKYDEPDCLNSHTVTVQQCLRQTFIVCANAMLHCCREREALLKATILSRNFERCISILERDCGIPRRSFGHLQHHVPRKHAHWHHRAWYQF